MGAVGGGGIGGGSGGPLGAAVVAAAMQQVAAQQAAAAAAAAAAANSALSAPSEFCSGCATREAAVACCSTCGSSLCPNCIMAHQVSETAIIGFRSIFIDMQDNL